MLLTVELVVSGIYFPEYGSTVDAQDVYRCYSTVLNYGKYDLKEKFA